MITLPPVTDSNTSRTFSLIRQHCMNRLSNPMPSARRPSHRRWLCTLDSSWNTTRRTWALSGTSMPISPSTALTYPYPWPLLQIPQTRSMMYVICW